jgi:long-chain fatty acid transport protein
MKKFFIVLLSVILVVALTGLSSATNGDNLIAIGPIARSMGGVGIAAPQDAISSVFSNPAAMCFGPFCPGSEFNFAGTLFMPKPSTKINIGGMIFNQDSDDKIYAIPAIGVSVPITNTLPLWRFGIAAYGVSGLGVDYRDTVIDNPSFYAFPSPPFPISQGPLVAGEFTQLQIMKFAPAIAYQPTENLSFGLAVHIDYANLDLRSGSSFNYGLGVQVGTLYKVSDAISVGLTYTSPQEVEYENIKDFDFDGSDDDLKLEQPQEIGFGLAIEPLAGKLLLEGDVKWVDWSGSEGYDDFDWENQWVFAVGAQFKPTSKVALRAGYNYADNPVKDHSGFNGGMPIAVQGKFMPTYYYETFRITGFPAIVQHHVTLGLGYEVSDRFALNLGYMHAFEETITERGTAPDGMTPAIIESSLKEDSLEFGLTWRF